MWLLGHQVKNCRKGLFSEGACPVRKQLCIANAAVPLFLYRVREQVSARRGLRLPRLAAQSAHFLLAVRVDTERDANIPSIIAAVL